MDKFISLFKEESNNNKANNNRFNALHINTSSDDLAKFTDEEKDEIISTLRVCTLKNKPLEEREEEFSTLCIAKGVSREDTEVAKGLFLYREPEAWELNILLYICVCVY